MHFQYPFEFIYPNLHYLMKQNHVIHSESSKFLPIQIDISERPFQVVFLYDGPIRCSGAWMGGKNILTSGVCCDGVR